MRRCPRLKPGTTAGFTLTELAVVLVIIALLMGGLLIPLSTQQEIEKRRRTEQQLLQIREALISFAIIHGRLPCPDSSASPLSANYGQENDCTPSAEAALPWRTLGLPEHDAWGQPWTDASAPRLGYWRYRIERGYAVSANLKNLILKTGTDCSLSSSPFPADCLDIVNNAGQALSAGRERPIAIVYSAGANQQADERNAVYDSVYQADTPTTTFDDQVVWLNRAPILNPLIGTGKLP
jgi:prepilin-type N-terminal cleavage/methylation domain-containing protein